MEFRILGAMEVLHDGQSLRLGGARPRTLLAILLTRAGRVVPTDTLIDELWEGKPPASAASALRVHVTNLRAALEPKRPRTSPSVRLPAAPGGYRLAAGADEVDAQQFERLLVIGREASAKHHVPEAAETIGRALDLWRDRPFADLTSIGCLQLEASRLEELRAGALEELMGMRLSLGQHRELVTPLERAVADFPLREQLTAHLMLALYRSGRQADALRAFARLRTTLGEELGIEPTAALRELEEAILLQKPELEGRDAPVHASRLPGPTRGPASSLVGRARELHELEQALDEIVAGDHGTVFVGGPPGIGKTSLVAALSARANQTGSRALYGRCDPEPTGNYQPFVEALSSYLREAPASLFENWHDSLAGELVRLLPELTGRLPAPVGGDGSSDTDRFRLFEAVVELFRRADEPVLLVLDDLHWANAPTLLLVRHLARHADPGRLMIVGTFRDTDVAPGHPLAELVVRLDSDGLARRLNLGALDLETVEALLQADAPAEVLAAILPFVDVVHEVTRGNPFFVKELVRELTERHADVLDADTLRAIAPLGVGDVVTQRLSRLSTVASTALRAASVIGQEFTLDLLASASGLDDDALLDAVEEALGARLVEERPGLIDCFGFSHALVRNVIYSGMASSRRVRIHRQVGEAIEQLPAEKRRGRLVELAHHFLEAAPSGVAEKAVQYTIDAADASLANLAFEDALSVCQRGLAVVDDVRGTENAVAASRECDLLIRLGRSELRAGRSGGREALLRAHGIARTLGDPQRLADAVLSVNRGFFARIGRTDTELVDALETAIRAQPQDDNPLRAELVATLASELVWAVDGERRFALSDLALEMSRRIADPRTLARVLLLRNMTISAPDTLDERISECDELLRIAEEIRDPVIRFQAAFHRSGTAMEAGDVDAANEMVELAEGLAHDLRQPGLHWQSGFMRTARRIHEGTLDDAERSATETFELGRRANQGGEALIFFTEQILEIRRWQDRLAEMIGDFRELAGVDGIDFGYSLIRYLYDAREHDAAAACYREIIERHPPPPRRDLLAVTTLCNLAYLAARTGDPDGARALYRALLPCADAFPSTTVSKPIGGHYLGMLAATTGDVDLAAKHFSAAAVSHERSRAPLLLAETQLEWARALMDRDLAGDRERAISLLERVRTAATRHESAFLRRHAEQMGV